MLWHLSSIELWSDVRCFACALRTQVQTLLYSELVFVRIVLHAAEYASVTVRAAHLPTPPTLRRLPARKTPYLTGPHMSCCGIRGIAARRIPAYASTTHHKLMCSMDSHPILGLDLLLTHPGTDTLHVELQLSGAD